MRVWISGLAMTLFVAGCAVSPETKPSAPPPSDVCKASQFQILVGQNRKALGAVDLPDPHRIIGPEMAVTADYRQDRLNIEYDKADVITKVSCF